MSNLRDITGMIFGDWKVIEFDNEGIWSNFKEKIMGEDSLVNLFSLEGITQESYNFSRGRFKRQ